MLKLFLPDLYIKDYKDLKIDYLRNKGIKMLICDIDNTLVPFDQHYPDDGVFAFIEDLKKNDIIHVLISNNKTFRVKEFAKVLNFSYYPSVKKQLKITYRKVLNDFQIYKGEVATLGDQLLTDVLGSKRIGLLTILAKPLVTRDINYTKINRFIERYVYQLLERKGYLKRGVFDEQV